MSSVLFYLLRLSHSLLSLRGPFLLIASIAFAPSLTKRSCCFFTIFFLLIIFITFILFLPYCIYCLCLLPLSQCCALPYSWWEGEPKGVSKQCQDGESNKGNRQKKKRIFYVNKKIKIIIGKKQRKSFLQGNDPFKLISSQDMLRCESTIGYITLRYNLCWFQSIFGPAQHYTFGPHKNRIFIRQFQWKFRGNETNLINLNQELIIITYNILLLFMLSRTLPRSFFWVLFLLLIGRFSFGDGKI